MRFVDPDPPGSHTLRLQMDSAARQVELSMPALTLQLAGDHGLLDVLTFFEPFGDMQRCHGGR